VGIYLDNIKEGCCDEHLPSLEYIDGDKLDSNIATCDKIIECEDKYILIEEKSFLLGFFNECCREKKVNFGSFIEKGYIKDNFFDFLNDSFSLDEKKRIFAETVVKLFMSSLDKVSNTTHILSTQHNANKSKNMPIVYLYCDSGHSKIDKLISLSLSKYKNEKREVFVECQRLEKFLNQKGCI